MLGPIGGSESFNLFLYFLSFLFRFLKKSRLCCKSYSIGSLFPIILSHNKILYIIMEVKKSKLLSNTHSFSLPSFTKKA